MAELPQLRASMRFSGFLSKVEDGQRGEPAASGWVSGRAGRLRHLNLTGYYMYMHMNMCMWHVKY